jgi:hypothetical protein
MNVRDFVYDADAYWCDAGKLYFERHVPSSVDTVGELETHLLNDADYESRMLGLHTEVGSYNEEKRGRHRALWRSSCYR